MVTRILRVSLVVVCVFALLWLFNSTTVTATRRPDDCGPPPTPEFIGVEPVSSPTTLHTQPLYVRLGNGRIISATSEAGTVAITGTFLSLHAYSTHVDVAIQHHASCHCHWTGGIRAGLLLSPDAHQR